MSDSPSLIPPQKADEAVDEVLQEFERRQQATDPNATQVEETAPQEVVEEERPQYAWRTYTEDELTEAEKVYQWARSLTPEQVAAIDAVLMPQPVQAPPPPSAPAETLEDEDDEIAALKREIAAVKAAQQQELYQTQYKQQLDVFSQQIDTTTASFAQQNNLSDEEIEELSSTLASSGMFVALSQQFGVEDGLRRGLDYFMATTPKFAERKQEAIRQQTLLENQKLEEKMRKASAVSAAPGSINKPEEPPTSQRGKKRANLSAVADFIAQNT